MLKMLGFVSKVVCCVSVYFEMLKLVVFVSKVVFLCVTGKLMGNSKTTRNYVQLASISILSTGCSQISKTVY